jgi:NAD(P)-dependent dehydrogenase (short-subunit alcohol dehydrogenase family)
MSDALSGGVAVITGAASGIGLGLARAAAGRGMKVVISDVNEQRLDEVEKELKKAGVETMAMRVDVTDPAAMLNLADQTFARFGAVRLLVNNAGVEMMGMSWEISPQQWERTLRINVLGPVNGVCAFAPRMIKEGRPAFISTIASVGGLGQTSGQAPYIVSKHAALSFSENLYIEMGQAAPHIKVSAVLPGPVATRIFTDAKLEGADKRTEDDRKRMHDMISKGLTGDQAGVLILDQIHEGRFWVSPHPEMMAESAKRRANYLANLAFPAMRPA